MQSASSRIWTRVAVSYADNHYTTGTSKLRCYHKVLYTRNLTLLCSFLLIMVFGIPSISWQFYDNFKAISKGFPCDFMAILWQFQGDFKRILLQFHGNFNTISRRFQKDSLAISWQFHDNLLVISRGLLGDFLSIHSAIRNFHLKIWIISYFEIELSETIISCQLTDWLIGCVLRYIEWQILFILVYWIYMIYKRILSS